MSFKRTPILPRFVLLAQAVAAGGLSLVGALPGLDSLGGAGGRGVAHASIMIALDLPTLVQKADHIAVVEVASVTAAWDQGHERIYSTIELNVIEKWKSAGGAGAMAPNQSGATERFTVVQPGGTVGDIRMTISGMGSFVPGERSLVFLRGPANRAQVVGMTQGKRAMRYLPSTRAWVVYPPDLRQAKLVRPPVGRPPAVKAPAGPFTSRPGAVRVSTPARPAAPSASSPGSSPPSSSVPSSSSGGITSTQTVQSPLVAAPAAVTRELPLEDVRSEIKRLIGTQRP